MASPLPTEIAYTGDQAAGVVVLVVCSALSLISVSGVFVILGLSIVRTPRSSDETLFIRSHIAMYFVSLLICNFDQAIGGLLNITWLVESRVYDSVACTAQGVIKQISNVGTPIFCFVIAVHTFSLLFLRRQWTDRTCYIILAASWALTFLEVCIEAFVIAKPQEIGPYFGLAGFWCWITPQYPIERYATSYLLMFLSAGLCSILYLLLFFKLRGNITVSTGYKIHFHRRPKVQIGRTSNGTYIMTGDRRIESHITNVAKHMLWYPIAYTLVILPMGASRFSTFSGVPVPSAVTIAAASLFMLHGFINTLLFCTTRNILPGTWRQRLKLSSTRSTGRSELELSSLANAPWRFTGLGTKAGTLNAGTDPIGLNMGLEKDLEISYDGALRSPASIKFGPPPPHDPPPRAHNRAGRQTDTTGHQTRQLSLPASRYSGEGTRAEIDRVDDDHSPDTGVHPASKEMITARGVPIRSAERADNRHESGTYPPVPALTIPAPVHSYALKPPTETANTSPTRSPSIMTSRSIQRPFRTSKSNGSGTTGWDVIDGRST